MVKHKMHGLAMDLILKELTKKDSIYKVYKAGTTIGHNDVRLFL